MVVVTLKTIKNGNLVVHNVPHGVFPTGIGPEQYYILGDAVINLAHIFKYMRNSKTSEFDYRDYGFIKGGWK